EGGPGPGARRLAGARPAPRREADEAAGKREPGERQPPREEVEALPRRRGEDGLAELRDQLPLDLAAGVSGGDARADERLHPPSDRRARLVQRRVAGRAHHLALELVQGRVSLTGERGSREGE